MLKQLSLATLGSAIIALVGNSTPAAAAQLFFNVSGRFFAPFGLDTTSIYNELDGGSLTGVFSLDSAASDQNPALGQGLYELSSWQIDFIGKNGQLVGRLTDTDGGGSADIKVSNNTFSPSSGLFYRGYSIDFYDVLNGGTRGGAEVNLFLRKYITLNPNNLSGEEIQQFFRAADEALPNVLPVDIIGDTSIFWAGITGPGNQVEFANESPGRPFNIGAVIGRACQ